MSVLEENITQESRGGRGRERRERGLRKETRKTGINGYLVAITCTLILLDR